MLEPVDSSRGGGSRRLRAALLRGAPAVLVALAIWIWFEQSRRSCDATARTWAQTLESDLRGGRAVLPPPAIAPEGWVAEQVGRILAEAARGDLTITYEPADPQVDSRTPAVRFLGADGGLRRLRLRCEGGSLEVIGFELETIGLEEVAAGGGGTS